jgi:hypothetical protein
MHCTQYTHHFNIHIISLVVGITPEGIWTNYPVFEIALQQTWYIPVVHPAQLPHAHLAQLPQAHLVQPTPNGVQAGDIPSAIDRSVQAEDSPSAIDQSVQAEDIPSAIDQWIARYAARRYGGPRSGTTEAWKLLGGTVS